MVLLYDKIIWIQGLKFKSCHISRSHGLRGSVDLDALRRVVVILNAEHPEKHSSAERRNEFIKPCIDNF